MSTDKKKLAVTIPEDTYDALTEFAKAKGVTVSEAVAALVKTAVGRRAAVNSYAERQAAVKRAEREAAELAAATRKAKAKARRAA